jgi:hypothetical protein
MAEAEVGEKVLVRWFCLDSNQEEVFEVTVVAVKKSKKGDRSSFSYSLLFPLGETRRTKNLSAKMIHSVKKRKSEIMLTQPTKFGKNFALPPHRFILAPMVSGSAEFFTTELISTRLEALSLLFVCFAANMVLILHILP